jgi:hypothetical protein
VPAAWRTWACGQDRGVRSSSAGAETLRRPLRALALNQQPRRPDV